MVPYLYVLLIALAIVAFGAVVYRIFWRTCLASAGRIMISAADNVVELVPRLQRSRGAQENAIAGLAASEQSGLAVDLCDIGVAENLERHERQPDADEETLHDVQDCERRN